MTYRFRLTAYHPAPGFFALDEKVASITLADGLEISLVPRDADTLGAATKYHFEAGGFPTEDAARAAGEHLRQSLQFLIAVFGLTLRMPTEDKVSSSTNQAIKDKAREMGLQLFDSYSGLSILPDDGMSAEFVVAGAGEVRPSDPTFVLKAIDAVWSLNVQLDDTSKRVLELLAIGAAHVSDVIKFLTTYLAVELLIPRRQRSPEAIALLNEFSVRVAQSDLQATERDGLVSALGHLRAEPFSVAFRSFMATIDSPKEFGGVLVKDLAGDSIRLRNAIAHQASPQDLAKAGSLANALRQFALSNVWTRHQIPPITLNRPADSIAITKFQVRIL